MDNLNASNKDFAKINEYLDQFIQGKVEFPQPDQVYEAIFGKEANELQQRQIESQKGLDQSQVCSKFQPIDTLFYKCFNCSDEPTQLICFECYQPDKHKNHILTYFFSNGGCCDCGDIQVIKPSGFCDKHQSVQIETVQVDPIKILTLDGYKNTLSFLQIGFAKLFQKIEQLVQYPINQVSVLQTLLEEAENQENQEIIDRITQELKSNNLNEKLSNMLYLYDLIFSYITQIANDNVRIRKIIAEILMYPIPAEIQGILPLFHSHSLDYENTVYVNKLPQKCNCSILQNILRYQVFLDSKHNNEELECEKAQSDILALFYTLNSHSQFKPSLCYTMINSTGIGSRMIRESQYTKDDIVLNEMNNYYQLSEVGYETIDFCRKALGFVFKSAHNYLNNSILYDYFVQFMGALMNQLSDHKFGAKAIVGLTQNYAKLSFWRISTFHYILHLEQRIFNQMNKEGISYLFNKFIMGLSEYGNMMKLKVLNSKDYKYITDKDQSILMHFFRFYPTTKQQFIDDIATANQQQSVIANTIFNQHVLLPTFQRLLRLTINHIQQTYDKIVELNFIRLLLYHHFCNMDCSKVQTYADQDRTILENYVMADKNFTILLAYYYQITLPVSPSHFKQDLISICGDQQHLDILLSTAIHRCLINIILIQNSGYQHYYSGQNNVFQSPNYAEPKQQAVDYSFIQIYIYMYQMEGITNVGNIINQFSLLYKFRITLNSFIVRIALQDNDMLNACGFIFQVTIPNELMKAGIKLIKQAFISQNFMTYTQLQQIMIEANLDKVIDLKTIVTQICELEINSGQLQLKQMYYPPTFEPCLFEGSKFQHRLIEKLEERNEKIVEMFGDALEFELANIDKEYSTLSRMRKSILEHLRNDQSQTVLKNIISELQKSIDEQNRESTRYILTSNSGYLNLMFILKQPLDSISELFQQFMKLIENVKQTAVYDNSFSKVCQLYLDKFIGIPKLEIIKPQEQNNNNNKKQMMIQKFNKLQNKFKDNQHEQTQEIEQHTDKVDLEIYKCSCCLLEIEDPTEGVYLVDAVPTILFDQFIHILDQNDLYGFQAIKDYCKIHVSSCMHVNHKKCIQNIQVSQHLTKLGYINCPNCFKQFNLQLPIKYNEKTIDEIQETTLDIICKSLVQDYFFGKYAQNDLKLYEMLQEFIMQMLISLIQQLLTDVYTFKEKQLYKIIGNLVQSLSLLLKENKVDLINTDNQGAPIVKIINILQKQILQDHNQEVDEELTQILVTFMDKESVDGVLQCLGFKQICISGQQHPNNEKLQVKQILSQHFQEMLGSNFEHFYFKYHLSKCSKCQHFPLIRQQVEILKGQYICLICYVKLCPYSCTKNDDQKEGNLQEHSRLQHYGKSIFVGTKTGAIIIQCEKFITKYKQGLFIDKLGQQPDLKADYAKLIEFTLNKKALADISDIILNERYLNYLVSFKGWEYTI